ncbi:MAG TPA: efflux RND transporter periplasmic adaptor subunit [bacterium]|nr:efflux RND transporter periplasmic adaptor subunit [bacterium]
MKHRWRLYILILVAFAAGMAVMALLNGLIAGEHIHDSGMPGSVVSQHAGDGSAESSVPPAPEVWTCSMHPQIRLPKPGRCPICFMDLIPLEETGGEGGPGGERNLTLSPESAALMALQTIRVERRDISAEIRLFGRVAMDERRVETVSARFPGRIERMFVDYTGQRVNAGDRLFTIYSPDLVSAQQELIQAVAAVERARNGGFGSLRRSAEATLDAAREKLRLWGFSTNQIASVEKRGSASDTMTVTAPAAGIVTTKHLKDGDYVTTGSSVYTIADLSRLWVLLEAYESDLAWLRTGQAAVFTTESLPGGYFSGDLVFISPVLNPGRRTVDVRLEVDNSEGRLKPGMLVNAVVRAPLGDITEPGDLPLVIPADAVLYTGTRSVVYVAHDSSGDSADFPGSPEDAVTYEGREVVLGPRTGDYYLVETGLSEGELVVVNGAFKIDAELQIRARPGMMSIPGQEDSPAGRLPVTDSFKTGFRALADGYFAIQAALASDLPADAKRAAGNTLEILTRLDAAGLPEAARAVWIPRRNAVRTALSSIANAPDIGAARRQFEPLSVHVTALVDRLDIGPIRYYEFHCPMAFDNAGANWLQRENDLRNPYYGAAMLKCGSLERELTGEP